MRTLSGRQVGNLSSGIAVAVTVLGLSRAIAMRWTCDDAWISFRYAENLVNGLGLVFNAGERVEGYTNFLWVLLSVPAFLLHVPPEVWANLWSLASFGAAVSLLAIRARLRRRESGGALSPIPVAAALVALNPDVQIWATGGLETSLFSALLVAGFVLLVGNDLRTGRLLASGAVFGLAALTRPDGILPAAVAAAWCAVFCRDRRVEKTLTFVAGVSLLVVPTSSGDTPITGIGFRTPTTRKAPGFPGGSRVSSTSAFSSNSTSLCFWAALSYSAPF